MAFCTRCGTGLPDAARFCPACGAATDDIAAAAPEPAIRPVEPASPGSAPLPPLKPAGGGNWILPVMIVVAVAVIGFFLWSQRNGRRPIAGNDGEPTTGKIEQAANTMPAPNGDDAADATTVSAIDAAFRTDPAAARQRHAGPLTVSGTLVSVTGGATPSLSLEGRTRFNYVVANVVDAAPFTGKPAGATVTLRCRSVTALAGTTILQACVPA